ncbi:MAG: histidinol-phosphate aminotransferase family protein [Bacteroidales bacterium]|jgi:histidinol-phosphate aminotransferase|nr:histidinol-phosphate aminotransferase family protein [Bacteroidales bacterium]
MDSNSIVWLDRNENQYGPSPECLKVLADSGTILLSDYSRDYLNGIKSPLSARLAADYGLSESNVILGYGGEDLLKQAIHCYVHEGGRIMIPSHSWWYYKKISDEVGGIKVEYPIVEGSDCFSYDLARMEEIYHESRPSLVLISSPNNPTGNRLEAGELEHLLGIMTGSVVVLDEAYSLFFNGSAANVTDLVRRFPNLIVIRTFSKYYGLAGLRIGYALTGGSHDRFALFSARYLGFNRLSEQVALAALDSKEYYGDVCRKMTSDLDMLFNEFSAMPGFRPFRSYANFILVEIPLSIKADLKQYLSSRNMIIKFMDEESLNSHIRVTIGTQEQNRLLVSMIKTFLKERKIL